MIDLKRVRAVALDIAGARQSHERQDDLSEFIWHLLERHYHMYLFSTDANEDLADEDFEHPRLSFLREEMPPGSDLLEAHPELTDPHTLWVTDHAPLQHWLRDSGLGFLYLAAAGSERPAGGEHLKRLSELSTLLDPTALLLRDVGAMIGDIRRFRPKGALLVGLGGPPRSGFQQLAVDLRRQLQDNGHELVELMDLSSLMRSTEALLDEGGTAGGMWASPEVGQWLHEAVLEPLRAGEPVYVERRPEQLPRDFDAHFPLYISEESIVLMFAELLFTPEVAGSLDLSILLEVSPEETTRRLYEIPPNEERFDPKFTEQYMKREGRIYQDYLRRNQVREKAGIRVDANRSSAFWLEEAEQTALV